MNDNQQLSSQKTNFALFMMYPQQEIYLNSISALIMIKKQIQQNLLQQILINISLQQQQVQFENESEHANIFEASGISDQNSISTSNCSNICHEKAAKKIKKLKNETKNVPKNFGKAIISFVQQKQELVRKFLKNQNVEYFHFVSALKKKKQSINSIADLRNLWLQSGFEYSKQMRIISLYFLKKGSLSYIFGSRISKHEGHIKYRNRLIEAIKNPQGFTFIKN